MSESSPGVKPVKSKAPVHSWRRGLALSPPPVRSGAGCQVVWRRLLSSMYCCTKSRRLSGAGCIRVWVPNVSKAPSTLARFMGLDLPACLAQILAPPPQTLHAILRPPSFEILSRQLLYRGVSCLCMLDGEHCCQSSTSPTTSFTTLPQLVQDIRCVLSFRRSLFGPSVGAQRVFRICITLCLRYTDSPPKHRPRRSFQFQETGPPRVPPVAQDI